MNVMKRLLISLLLLAGLGLLKASEVSAAITKSPHDIVGYYGYTKTLAGICAYCHVPHSAKGDRLFPKLTADEQGTYGSVAGLCAKCHQDNSYIGPALNVNDEIFRSLTAVGDDSMMDSHPVKGTGQATQPYTLQNTSLDSVVIFGWPWASNDYDLSNKGSAPDIECSTCHNPHDWNPNVFDTSAAYGPAKRKFLRAPIYNKDGDAGRKNFCSFCHQNREDASSNSPTGTHPVADGPVGGGADSATFQEWRATKPEALKKDIFNPDSDTGYLIRIFSSISVSDTTEEGRAIWDSSDVGAFLGARVYNDDQVICQSCHMPHGAPHAEDDVYSDLGTPNQLRVGPLLAVNNASVFGDTRPSGQFTIFDYPYQAETTFRIDVATHEQNLLCEWCHGVTPDLQSDSVGSDAFAHPVNRYVAADTAGDTRDNIPSQPEHGALNIKYPLYGKKYRESGGISGAAGNSTLTAGGARGTGFFLVCESCHEPHQAWKGTPLLKYGMETTVLNKPGDSTFCDGCHYDTAMGVGADLTYFSDWTTHPSGPTATLLTSDAETASVVRRLPNRAGLQVFRAGPSGTEDYISCWTCHKAHKGVELPLLADYQTPFSQICVNCHCEGDTNTTQVRANSKTGNYIYGTTAAYSTNGNPSYYYMEGAYGAGTGGWWDLNTYGTSPAEFTMTANLSRLGSHYIGQYSTGRPDVADTDTTNKGWLGERTALRVALGVAMNDLDHRPGTNVTGMDEKDRWLLQPMVGMAAGTYDTAMVFETMIWNGSGQKSHIGRIGTEPVLVCQSCHVAHNSAVGVADNDNISRLLLAPNIDSYMCKRCHIPEADTTMTHPMTVDTTGATYNVGITSGKINFKYNTLVTRTGSVVNMTSGSYAYGFGTAIAPANYPTGGGAVNMNCDACHSAHNADSKMGAMILEGNNTAPTSTNGIDPIYWNKVPTMEERDDKITCDLCHMQGK